MASIRTWTAGVVAVAALLLAAPAALAVDELPLPGDDDAEAPDLDTQRLTDPQGAGAAGAQAQVVDGEPLVGLFELDAGTCDPSGTYFRMVQPGGDPDEGPFVDNGDSPCDDGTVTPLSPGTDGGLSTVDYQPNPDPAFGPAGNGLAARITEPQAFFGVDFAVATNPTDPQTGEDVPVPEIVHDGAGNLGGDTRAFGVAWNRQHFNQGAPKPDGSTPGQTSPPSGTYDPGTGRFELVWVSQIEGGPFDGFTGVWHLAGTFQAEADPDPGRDATDDEAAPEVAEAADPDPDTAATADALPDTGPPAGSGAGLALLGLAALAAVARRRWVA